MHLKAQKLKLKSRRPYILLDLLLLKETLLPQLGISSLPAQLVYISVFYTINHTFNPFIVTSDMYAVIIIVVFLIVAITGATIKCLITNRRKKMARRKTKSSTRELGMTHSEDI